jgi:predicted RNase H-like HicB family nuclease
VTSPKLRVEFDRETGGRWIAELIDLPGVMADGDTRSEALTNVKALAVIVIADRIGLTRHS